MQNKTKRTKKDELGSHKEFYFHFYFSCISGADAVGDGNFEVEVRI